jgi:hypothetical protein
MKTEGNCRNSSPVAGGAAQHHTMGVPEIFSTVEETLCPVYKPLRQTTWKGMAMTCM